MDDSLGYLAEVDFLTLNRNGVGARHTVTDRLPWWLLNAFLFIFPVLDGLRIYAKAHLSPGVVNLWILVLFVCYLLVVEVASGLSGFAAKDTNRQITYGKERHVAPRTAITLLAIFVLLSVLATFHSVNVPLSVFGLPGEYGGVVPTIGYAVLFVWTVYRVHPNQYVPLMRTLVFASIIPTLYGILQHIHHVPGIPCVSRSFSLFCNADFYGTYMALVMLLTITLLAMESRRRAFGYLLLLVVQCVGILFSSTRSAWLGGIVGGILFITVVLASRPQFWKRFSLAIVVLFGTFVALNHLSHNQVASRASTIVSNAKQVVTSQNRNYVASSRWYIWKESVPLVRSHPLLGTGPDTFEQVFQPPQSGAKKYLDGQPIANANNAYVQVAVTSGIPTLLVNVAFYLIVLRRAVRATRAAMAQRSINSIRGLNRTRGTEPSQSQSKNLILTTGLLAAVVSYLIQAFFNMDVITVAPMFWVVLGLLYRSTL